MPAPEEPRDLEDLLNAAGRSVQPTAFGWQTLPARLAQTPQKQPLTLQRWATLPLGVAAAATLFLVLWLGTSRRDEAVAGPIQVQRQGIELTILSVAETEGETLYMPFAARPAAPQRKRTGQALVRDRRLILNLRRGDNVVRFTDVAATIDPTSVRFESRTDALGTRVVEQAFEYDLATADALLKRYLDRPVTCIGKDGEERSGHLASFDEQTIVLASAAPGEGKQRTTESISRRGLRAVRLADAPTDLVTRPTLVWKLRTQTPGRHETVLSYVCGFLMWQANYVVLVTPGRGKQPDLLDVSGWVTIDNASGTAYPDAALRLIAGDVNRIRDPWFKPNTPEYVDPSNFGTAQTYGPPILADFNLNMPAVKKELVEKSFFEYHLYALTVPSTLGDRQIKQLNLLKRQGVKASRRYVYDSAAHSRHLLIELVAKNDKDNQLGLPLPKGAVAIEQRDAHGETALLGRTEIDHTAVKEKLELSYQYAFDVVGEHRAVGVEYLWVDHWQTTYELRVRNHKAEAIEVRAFAHRLGRNSTLVEASAPHHRKDFETVYFDFTLPANAEQVVRYTLETQE